MDVIECLRQARVSAPDELDQLRNQINLIPGQGEKAQPRMAITVAALEIVQRVYGGFASAYKEYCTLIGPLDWLEPPRQKNFTNFLNRNTMTGDGFDLFEALILILHTIDENSPAFRERARQTLTPYQKYLVDWGQKVLMSRLYQPPRRSTDEGPSQEASDARAANHRAGYFIGELGRMQHDARLSTLFGDGPAGVNSRATFVCFRTGLAKPTMIVQSFLAILAPSASASEFHTFAHIYQNLGGGRSERISRGILIPSEKNVYLMGFMSAKSPVERDICKNTMDLIAIPRVNISETTLIGGLTLSANSDDKPLVSRIVLRRTPLPTHENSGVDVYPVGDLPTRLAQLHGAEAPSPPPSSSAKSKPAALTIPAEAVREAETIAERVNNLAEWSLVDLFDEQGLAYASEHFRRQFSDVFLDVTNKQPRFHDSLQRPYRESLHRRIGAVKAD